MQVVSLFAALFSVLVPAKMWYGVKQAVDFKIDSKEDVTLVLTDFAGKKLEAKGSVDASAGKTVDVKSIYPQLSTLGTYVLFAVPKGKSLPDFLGTPVVIEIRGDKEGGTAPSVTAVEPLQYGIMQTEQGPLKMIFYYDVAPLTVDNFLKLSEQGYYDGLTFHRIVPSFVIQGGDPRGDGTGGPGYSVDAEFNAKPHEAGVLSMARAQDPNSAGSQFFVCLDYAQTKQLDHKYTGFGKVVEGMDAVNKIAAAPLADKKNGTPKDPQIIKGVTLKAVTAKDNPYAELFSGK
ncbi:MAG TPA: peptidylprolyl isomerase [Tepidisphaeraceae bacterium]|jgi:peptidyl-prolyl cis-trans isomerase B (cyclophilin B)